MSNQSGNGNNRSVGCCIMNSLVDVFSNLFSTEPFCGNGNGNNWGNNGRSNSFNNGFVSGVNAVSALNGLDTTNDNNGCGCNNNFASGFSSGVRAANALLDENDNSGGCRRNGRSGNGRNGNGRSGNGRNGNGRSGNGRNSNGNGWWNNGSAFASFFNDNSGNSFGCGSNADLSSFTACDSQCFDAYYAEQYGLYPFNQNGNGCGCNNGF